MRRLFFDIETSYYLGWFWRPSFKTQITYDQVIKDSAIICISYKWQGSDKVYSLKWDKGCDKALLKKLYKVIEEADEVVAHNGDNFDIKWIKTRFLTHGYKSIPMIKSIDTLKMARKFKFPSNRLDAIGKQLGFGGKLQTRGIDMWHDIILRNNRKAMNEMVSYCERDVVLLEKIYLKMEGFVPPKTHIGINSGSNDKCDCPYCGAERTTLQKRRITSTGNLLVQMKCQKCGKYFQVTLSAYNKRKEAQNVRN